MSTLTLPRDSDGKLARCAWPGGYPLFYVTQKDDCLCPSCANDERDEYEQESNPVVACDANWEDPHMYCDECSQRIESAYAEDEV